MLHLVTTALDARIRQAISQKRLVEVCYNGWYRVAEPHDYGKLNGVDCLLIYQLRSKADPARESKGWRLLDVPKIESMTILDGTFKGSRSDAHQSHHVWDVIYVRVE